ARLGWRRPSLVAGGRPGAFGNVAQSPASLTSALFGPGLRISGRGAGRENSAAKTEGNDRRARNARPGGIVFEEGRLYVAGCFACRGCVLFFVCMWAWCPFVVRIGVLGPFGENPDDRFGGSACRWVVFVFDCLCLMV
ncbi:hypothetical protein DQ04_04251000, partial [Trypanosoma grayi]|uniref:hypothetical protein n=1 Tax=Trypanosoma grayi TaxID=71804 RepID=UPI0004F4BBB8